jgi:Flp pilus assembly protein TadG
VSQVRRARSDGAGPDDRRGTQLGQATVELALIMPLLILLILAIVQIGVLVHTRVLVTHAAREAVREAAVGASGSAVAAAAAASGPLAADRLAVSVSTTGGRVEVGVHYDAPTDVFLVGPLLRDVGFDASATMRRED